GTVAWARAPGARGRDPLRRLYGTPRAAGAWGLVFVVLLFASAAMVSLPTAALGGERIAAFYAAHAQLIVIQQVVGLVALAAFVLLDRKSTRLNSSHDQTSYAVFCLKKKRQASQFSRPTVPRCHSGGSPR